MEDSPGSPAANRQAAKGIFARINNKLSINSNIGISSLPLKHGDIILMCGYRAMHGKAGNMALLCVSGKPQATASWQP